MMNATIADRAAECTPSAAPTERYSAAGPSPASFIRRHPVITFYVLAFAISWAGILLVVGGPANYPSTSTPEAAEDVGRMLLLLMVPWFAGPSLASIALTGVVSGRAGFRDLLARLVRWRVRPQWYVVALLTAPVLDVTISYALSLISNDFLPGIVTTADKTGLLVMGIAYGLLGGGLLEELGWTGFAVPRIRQRYSMLATGVLVGVLWGAYHLSVMFYAANPSGVLSYAVLLAQMFAWMPAFRVLMVWLYDHTQSLLLAVLMHASLSAGMFILQPAAAAGATLLTYLLIFAAVVWVLAAIVALTDRARTRQQIT